jgi:hypothetical protein
VAEVKAASPMCDVVNCALSVGVIFTEIGVRSARSVGRLVVVMETETETTVVSPPASQGRRLWYVIGIGGLLLAVFVEQGYEVLSIDDDSYLMVIR